MTKYEEYAKLKAQIKELEGKTKQLEIDLINDLLEKDGEKLETQYATFSIYSKPKWNYSDKLVEQEKLVKDKIKLMKKEEEIKGIAKMESNGSILRCVLRKD